MFLPILCFLYYTIHLRYPCVYIHLFFFIFFVFDHLVGFIRYITFAISMCVYSFNFLYFFMFLVTLCFFIRYNTSVISMCAYSFIFINLYLFRSKVNGCHINQSIKKLSIKNCIGLFGMKVKRINSNAN